MTVEQKFNAHLVPEVHRVRQATSEFKNFAIIWWSRVCNDGLAPTTWDALKVAMRNRFIPPSFKRGLRKKLQRLNQGNRSVEEYYQELQISMLRCDIIEDEEAAMARFYGGLTREIQDIVDYKEYDSVPRLFHLTCLVEKELQGRQQRPRNNFGSTSTPRSTSGHVKIVPPSATRSAAPSSSRARSAAPSTPSQAPKVNKSTSVQVSAKISSSVASTSRTTGIICHRCKGMGHVMRDFPSQRAYLATEDGGYVSASDIEDEYVLAANIAGGGDEIDSDADEVEEQVAAVNTGTHVSLVAQRVLSAQVERAE